MEAAKLSNHFGHYFNSKTYSDVTIVYDGGSKSLPGHKLVLAQGSDYFKRCLNGNFVESKTSIITLQDDPAPQVIPLLIKTLYGHKAYDLGKVDSAETVMEVIDLHIAANKYLVPGLCSEITHDLPVMLEQLQAAGMPLYGDLFNVFDHVYTTRRDEGRELRPVVTAHVVKHISNWKEDGYLQMLLEEIPTLAQETVFALAEAKENPSGRKGVAAAAGKRKRKTSTYVGMGRIDFAGL